MGVEAGDRCLYNGRGVTVLEVLPDTLRLRYVSGEEIGVDPDAELAEYCCDHTRSYSFLLTDWPLRDPTHRGGSMTVEGSCSRCNQTWRSLVPLRTSTDTHVRYFRVQAYPKKDSGKPA